MPATVTADNTGNLALVQPMGGRVSAILSALYENYMALHPTRTTGTARALAVLANPAPAGIDYAAQSKVGDTPIRSTASSVLVNINVAGDVATARKQLEALGMSVNGEFQNYLGGTLPISAVGQLSQMSNIIFADADYGCRTHTGKATSQGDLAQRSDTARTTSGKTGTGVTVGVLSDSFNKSGNGSYSADVANGELPSNVNILQDYPTTAPDSTVTDEGRGMLQIVYDVAPGANLAFATAYTGQIAFAANIKALKAAGCKVIVDDIGYLDEPFFTDGPVAQAVDTVVAGGAAYFSAAGNSGRSSYESAFRPSSTTKTIGSVSYVMHNFNSGTGAEDIYQRISIPSGATINLAFQWDDPFKSIDNTTVGTGAVTDLDIFLYDSTDTTVLKSAAVVNAGGNPSGIFAYKNSGSTSLLCDIAIGRRDSTSGTPYMKYVDFEGNIVVSEYGTKSGTSIGHPNAAGCEAVGAAYWKQTPVYGSNPPVVESFSSGGGVAIHRDTAGNFIGAKLRNTPDIVAPDGGNTSFFGQDSTGIDTDTYPNFFGTSAAAPHAAGVAALMLQANTSATPAQLYRSLERTAVDMGTKAGYDYDTGYGLINANLAVQDITTASSATTGVVISEFRERGSSSSNSAGDEYVELYNPTSSPLNISGWILRYTSSSAVVNLPIPGNTTIPAYGHYLLVGAGYSLANYGGTNAAAGNQVLTSAIDDASSLILFNASSVAQDTITFGDATIGLTAAPTVLGEYAFVRQFDPVTGTPMTGANSFVFVATNGGSYTATKNTLLATLGAPGPENLTSPVFTNGINVTLLNPSLSNSASPNRVRVTGATGTNAANGTLSIRRIITNNTGAPITKLRFRITNLTTFNSPSYSNGAQADLRLLTSPSDVQTVTVNGTTITVYGTAPSAVPAQGMGGGVNSSNVQSDLGTVTLSTSIPINGTRAYDFTFGVQRSGDFAIALLVERLSN